MKKFLFLLGAGYYIKTKKPELWESMKKNVCGFLNINTSAEGK